MMFDSLEKYLDRKEWGKLNWRGEKDNLVRTVQNALTSFEPISASSYKNNPIQLIDFFPLRRY